MPKDGRDRRHHQDGAAARSLPAWHPAARRRAVWTLAHPNPRPREDRLFIAGLRCDALTAPWVVDKALDRAAFDLWVETQLAPTLSPGDVVILDNLAVHKSAKAARILRDRGAWFLFLPLTALT